MKFRVSSFQFPAAILAALFAVHASAQSTQPDAIEQRVRTVLAAMRSPAANGVLITELGSAAGGSLAAEAEAREGDIITHYQGRRVNTFEELREAVAEAIASKETNPNVAQKVLLGVKRGEKELVLQVRRGPLGLRGVNAQAGVRLEPNPVATPRGEYQLSWGQVPERPKEMYLRVYVKNELHSVEVMELVHLSDTQGRAQHAAWPASGEPGIVHDVHFQHEAKGGPLLLFNQMRVKGVGTELFVRRGNNILVGDSRKPTRNDALPESLLPLAAAALPFAADVAVPVSVLRTEDGETRSGYVLLTRGEVDLPDVKGAKAHQVDLLLFGSVIERYWLSKERDVLRMEIYPGIVKVRAATKKAAMEGVKIAPTDGK